MLETFLTNPLILLFIVEEDVESCPSTVAESFVSSQYSKIPPNSELNNIQQHNNNETQSVKSHRTNQTDYSNIKSTKTGQSNIR